MGGRNFSCETAAGTLAWIDAIAGFLRSYRWLTDAHLVNFFQDRLWEEMDQEWLDCLRDEPVENLLRIPSGFVKDNWPVSLQDFVATARSLTLPRERKNWETASAFSIQSLDSVISQGMNMKKKHEVEILAAVITTIADDIGAKTVIDVGAGQGYLAQVLSFQCKLPVVALDASPHHGTVTSSRAERIRKHYLAQALKLNGNRKLNVPKTVTCNIHSSDVLTSFSATLCEKNDTELVENSGNDHGMPSEMTSQGNASTNGNESMKPSLLLAGLHACGNLSVNMLRTFLDCKEVKAVVSIGCCYNLLSEEQCTGDGQQCGFPLSDGVKSSGLILGKNARDLACQSAERWASLTSEVAYQNFEIHAFRAAFQLALYKHHPNIVERSPSIGRQGKALRRRWMGKALQSQLVLNHGGVSDATDIGSLNKDKDFECAKVAEVEEHFKQGQTNEIRDRCNQSTHESDSHFTRNDRYVLFEEFCNSGLGRLGLGPSNIDFYSIWREALPYFELIGPYWSLRAALGPLVETLILLDRLLFLQEKGGTAKAKLFSLFDPIISPRNMAIIVQRANGGTIV
ncbi:unnamed protein product [Victoria cruziana]